MSRVRPSSFAVCACGTFVIVPVVTGESSLCARRIRSGLPGTHRRRQSPAPPPRLVIHDVCHSIVTRCSWCCAVMPVVCAEFSAGAVTMVPARVSAPARITHCTKWRTISCRGGGHSVDSSDLVSFMQRSTVRRPGTGLPNSQPRSASRCAPLPRHRFVMVRSRGSPGTVHFTLRSVIRTCRSGSPGTAQRLTLRRTPLVRPEFTNASRFDRPLPTLRCAADDLQLLIWRVVVYLRMGIAGACDDAGEALHRLTQVLQAVRVRVGVSSCVGV